MAEKRVEKVKLRIANFGQSVDGRTGLRVRLDCLHPLHGSQPVRSYFLTEKYGWRVAGDCQDTDGVLWGVPRGAELGFFLPDDRPEACDGKLFLPTGEQYKGNGR